MTTIIVFVVFIFIIIIGLIIYVGNIAAAIVIPPQKCPHCNTDMQILMSNIYTGQVCYECPSCGERMTRHYEEDEMLDKEGSDLQCPLCRKKSETDKSKER